MPKMLILNGPPLSGKDTIASQFEVRGWTHLRFKTSLWWATDRYYGLPDGTTQILCDRSTKEVPQDVYDGKTPREAVIHVSERVVKPYAGKAYFGADLALQSLPFNRVVVSDGGFSEELRAVSGICPHDVYVARIHRGQYTFEGDSRSYLKSSDVVYPGRIGSFTNVDGQLDLTIKSIAHWMGETLE